MPLLGFFTAKYSSDCDGGYRALDVGVALLGVTLALLGSGEGTSS